MKIIQLNNIDIFYIFNYKIVNDIFYKQIKLNGRFTVYAVVINIPTLKELNKIGFRKFYFIRNYGLQFDYYEKFPNFIEAHIPNLDKNIIIHLFDPVYKVVL